MAIPEMERAIRPWRDFRAFWHIRKILKQIKPDIVHTHSSKAGILGRWAAYAAGVPVILHSVHGFAFSLFQPRLRNALYTWAERFTSRITTHFISVSLANIEEGESNRIFTEENVTLLRSGVDVKHFAEAHGDPKGVRREFGFPENAKLVIMAAVFKPQKAPLDFIRSAQLLHDDLPEARFLLVGDGELRPAIEESIRQKGLKGIVALSGWRDDIAELMKASDVLALSSLWEGLPQVFPQAMAAGLPIVATDVDGASEIIQDGITGILVPPHEPRRFADALLLFFEDESLRKRMAIAAPKYLDGFDQDEMVESQERLYHLLTMQGLRNKSSKSIVGESHDKKAHAHG